MWLIYKYVTTHQLFLKSFLGSISVDFLNSNSITARCRSLLSSIPEWSIIVDNTTAQTPTPNNKRNSKKKKMMKKGIREMWNEIFLLVCVIAVSLDPLFFYIPTVNDDDKCLKMDKKLISSALVLRSLTDMVYLIDVGFNMVKAYESLKREESLVGKRGQLVKTALAVAPRLSWSLVVVDLLSILPIPQVRTYYQKKNNNNKGKDIQ